MNIANRFIRIFLKFSKLNSLVNQERQLSSLLFRNQLYAFTTAKTIDPSQKKKSSELKTNKQPEDSFHIKNQNKNQSRRSKERDQNKSKDKSNFATKQRDRDHSSSKQRDRDHSTGKQRDRDHSTSKQRDSDHSSSKQRDNNYSSSKQRDNNYSSSKQRDNNYSSSKPRDRDHSTSKQRDRDHSSSKQRDNNYSSSNLKEKDHNTKEIKYKEHGSSNNNLKEKNISTKKQKDNGGSNSNNKAQDKENVSSDNLKEKKVRSYKQKDKDHSNNKLKNKDHIANKQKDKDHSSNKQKEKDPNKHKSMKSSKNENSKTLHSKQQQKSEKTQENQRKQGQQQQPQQEQAQQKQQQQQNQQQEVKIQLEEQKNPKQTKETNEKKPENITAQSQTQPQPQAQPQAQAQPKTQTIISVNKYNEVVITEKKVKTQQVMPKQKGSSQEEGQGSEEEEIEDFADTEQDEKTSLTQKLQEATSIIVDKEDLQHKCIFKTRYGYLKLVNSCLTQKQQMKINKIYYLYNTIPTNYIRKIIKSDKNALLAFTPDSNMLNVRQHFESFKKILNAQYYGTPKKIRNPFKNCTSNAEIFNLARRIQNEQKQMLHRICMIANYDGTLRIKGKVPQVGLLKKFTQITHPVKEIQGGKFDFLIPYATYTGILSADNYEKAGSIVNALNSKKIFNWYGVFPATNNHIYDLFPQYIRQKQNLLKADRTVLDIGTGSGILGLIFANNSNSVKVYGIDKDQEAVECSRLNSQILNFAERYDAKKLDLVETDENEVRKIFEEWNFPQRYDIIVANPPWINASYMTTNNNLENGVYDPKLSFLRRIFQFASQRLNNLTKISKKGRLLLLYSDISEILQLSEKNIIEKLCQEYKLIITDQLQTRFVDESGLISKKSPITQLTDPLQQFKNQSKVFLYEITRP